MFLHETWSPVYIIKKLWEELNDSYIHWNASVYKYIEILARIM
jgi:hypothetical protein